MRNIGKLAALCLLVLAGCAGQETPATSAGGALAEVSRANGEAIFWAGGCASCHAGAGRVSSKTPELGGGEPIRSDFGTFRGPNISPDPEAGIGGWSLAQFDRALRSGIAPDGHAYYPAFPYDSFVRLRDQDVADLFAFLKSLPVVPGEVAGNAPVFPVSLPVAAEGWRRMYLRPGPAVTLADAGAEVARGQYLAEGPGHCGTCHTPRTPLGGARLSRWLGGAELLDGSGTAPNLTPHEDGLGVRSIEEIVEALHPLDPELNYSGMNAARVNLTHLPESDLRAIAAYLKALPAVASAE
ncbi:mono/diheme cytochrome c family protein [Aliiruegeria haliotis]|uniref:Mono/diheme cytochrome c family protein n=1 Tax=Aliiruegeria haliotis TaxID=1280846 RepID=A0A2T0RYG9_9RHOB|nr:cytochrome c [Aliiruegeria haliotis]PRY26229.1 mono/diheme cytochrome c family protein [Aliiruegeria haliotis]